MRLLIERSQRHDWLGRRWYQLSVALETNVVEREVITSHDLGTVELWVSSVFLAYENEALGRFENSDNTIGWSNAMAWRRLRLNREGLSARRASFAESFITVDDLLVGVAHEAREVSELMNMEGGLRSGFETLRQRIELLARYEDKDVLVVEPEKGDDGLPASKWVTMR